MKPMPSLSIACAVSAGLSPMCAPKASSTSALPEDEDTERPMCFATLAPAAAATNAAQVDTLNVRGVAAGAAGVDEVPLVGDLDRRRELAHHLRGRGDLADGLLLHAQPDDEAGDLRRAELAAHDLAHDVQHLVVEHLAVLDGALDRLGDRDLLHGALPLRKFSSIRCPCSVSRASGWNCTLRRESPVAQPHDLSASDCALTRGTPAATRARRPASGSASLRTAARNQNPPAIVRDARNLAVHDLPRAHHLAAEGLADRLVAEAHAEDGNLAREARHGLERDAGLVRRAGPATAPRETARAPLPRARSSSSFRITFTSAPSSPKYCTRLKVNES